MEKLIFESMLDNSGFIMKQPEITEPALAMAFVNMQPITDIYPVETAFNSGTLFKNIDMPLVGRNPQC